MSEFDQLKIEKEQFVAKQFRLKGEILSIKPFGSGHINDTFRVDTSSEEGTSYLLQRINHHVFPDVEGLMNNIKVITSHLRSKVDTDSGAASEYRVLTLIPTTEDKLFFVDHDDGYWRMFILIDETRSYDIVETEQQAAEGGRAFGLFQRQLSDLPVSAIVEVLHQFHNIEFRLNNLYRAIDKDCCGRLKYVTEDLNFITAHAEKMNKILLLGRAGKLPLRIIHNDTKFNNVLLDKNDKAQCVIDLDTVMPGYVAYDFGDAIRTIINPVAEDERDLSRIRLNLPFFKAYTEGYLEQAAAFLTPLEKETLVDGALLLPYMQGVRFLTDYLEGDHYFKVRYPDHNLVRTRTQLKLVHEMEENEIRLRAIVDESE